jgi:hypothetical protein
MHVAMIRRLHLQPKDGCRFDDPEEMNIDVHNAVELLLISPLIPDSASDKNVIGCRVASTRHIQS